MSERTPITAPAAPAAVGPYSQAIRHGDLIFCSGALPLDPGPASSSTAPSLPRRSSACEISPPSARPPAPSSLGPCGRPSSPPTSRASPRSTPPTRRFSRARRPPARRSGSWRCRRARGSRSTRSWRSTECPMRPRGARAWTTSKRCATPPPTRSGPRPCSASGSSRADVAARSRSRRRTCSEPAPSSCAGRWRNCAGSIGPTARASSPAAPGTTRRRSPMPPGPAASPARSSCPRMRRSPRWPRSRPSGRACGTRARRSTSASPPPVSSRSGTG